MRHNVDKLLPAGWHWTGVYAVLRLDAQVQFTVSRITGGETFFLDFGNGTLKELAADELNAAILEARPLIDQYLNKLIERCRVLEGGGP